MCIYSIVLLFQKLSFKIANLWLLFWAVAVGLVGAPPRVLIVRVPETCWDGEMDDDRAIVMEVECVVCMLNLDGRLVFIFIRAGISVSVLGLAVVGWCFSDNIPFRRRKLTV